MRQQVNLWPIMEDKEKWVRFTACAAAPFQIFVVSGCNDWTDLFSCLVTDWAVVILRILSVSLLDRLEVGALIDTLRNCC